ncbi:ectonucleoside triphosphate diphosphohydrolase 3 isoform X2 [Corythoichthys intestinalis]|nr:ectonucleoside triphosphate diphosphohydrolase 3 isoform X2 [Corythoichthys intestinalis]XP_057690394.1 ectonucleoside triphosphate diphosphohydrolase 3 isoform X2 [Corythoichthys intestinalis]XP_057690395.1 ectonucleoside triphosphate diphosphohydrolase 3 isoform X2 [Corythoichthys intestinalis]XP_061789820.1 ectonucleoside triphosphate diphosphohydrolase 3 [Nerophis lumbriciformis]
MASTRKVGYKCRIATVLLILLGSIAGLIAVAVIQGHWRSKEYSLEYGIVIDSGSSRSNIYLYEWPGEKENETGVVTEKLNCKVSGVAISELKNDPKKDAQTWKGFRDCMKTVSEAIPAKKHKTTPLFLGATAGMRLLQEKDMQRANEVLDSLKEYLQSLPFDFQNASIITGQEEGLYGWITVNYLMDNFIEKTLWNTYIRPQSSKTVGSMDLGGASTQIAFAVNEDLTGDDYLHVKLYGYPYNVYTHSFLCYGKNEAGKRLLDKVIQESSDPANVDNPCYPNGVNETIPASDIYDTECTKKPKNYRPDQKYMITGSGNSEECRRIVKSMFDFTSCSSAHCSFDGVEQPPVTGAFMAYAGYFYVVRALLMNESTDTIRPAEYDEFKTSMKQLCNTPWSELRTQKEWVSDRYLRTYCFATHYIFSLLNDGYKFDATTWKDIHFQKEVKSTSVGWSLGYMLSSSNMIPSEVNEVLPFTNPVFAGLIFLFSALTIITVILIFIILIRTCY